MRCRSRRKRTIDLWMGTFASRPLTRRAETTPRGVGQAHPRQARRFGHGPSACAGMCLRPLIPGCPQSGDDVLRGMVRYPERAFWEAVMLLPERRLGSRVRETARPAGPTGLDFTHLSARRGRSTGGASLMDTERSEIIYMRLRSCVAVALFFVATSALHGQEDEDDESRPSYPAVVPAYAQPPKEPTLPQKPIQEGGLSPGEPLSFPVYPANV